MKKLSLFTLVLFSFLALSACSSSDDSVLIVASGADPVTFDMHATNDIATARIARQIYETLIFQSNDLEILPGLATSWKEIGDNTFEFELRDDVFFHNGDKFTAADVEYTFRRALESPTIRHIIGAIDPDKIQVVDEYTIRIGTKFAFGPFITHLAHPATSIKNERAVVEAGEDYGSQGVVGTGPFKFVEWNVGDKVVLERFEEYWGETAQSAGVEFRTIRESNVRVIGLENGEIDIAYDVAPSDIPVVNANSQLSLINTPNLGAEYLGLNWASNPYLKDANVRKAIAHMIDVEAIVEAIYNNVGTQMTGPINSSVFGYNPNIQPIPYNEQLAREFLAQSQWPTGAFTLRLFVGDNSAERIRVAQVVQTQLEKLGITVSLNQMEWGAFLAETAKPAEESQTDLFMLGWTTVTADADYGLYPLFHSQTGPAAGNRTFYSNPRVDELLDLGRGSIDQAVRLGAYQEAQAIIAEDLPWVFLQTRENVSAYREGIDGFEHHPMGSYFLAGVRKTD
jgi:peptide/nickel transport system substrate-binding protein